MSFRRQLPQTTNVDYNHDSDTQCPQNHYRGMLDTTHHRCHISGRSSLAFLVSSVSIGVSGHSYYSNPLSRQ